MSVYFHEEDLPEGALGPGPVAVDTETMGLLLARDRLCLVQISDGRGDEHLVRFAKGSDYAAPNLKAVLADPDRLKLYHFARFDLAVMQAYLGVIAAPVYCTKTASRLIAPSTPARPQGSSASVAINLQAAESRLGRAWLSTRRGLCRVRRALSPCAQGEAESAVARGPHARAAACFDFSPSAAWLRRWAEQDIFAHD